MDDKVEKLRQIWIDRTEDYDNIDLEDTKARAIARRIMDRAYLNYLSARTI